jgi:hypothetical protein
MTFPDGTVSISNCFWDNELFDSDKVTYYDHAEIINTYGLPTAQMKEESTFVSAGWDFVYTWAIDNEINEGYPHLLFLSPDVFNSPRDLVAIVESNDVHLEWTEPEEGSSGTFEHYNVYRDGEII